MKAAKLIIGMLVMIFLIAPLASAIDVPPVLSLNGDYDRTTTTATLTAVGVDILDNTGLAWIKIYEDGVLISEKDCNGDTTCTLVEVAVKTAPSGTFEYQAEALDKGGNRVFSENVTIVFAGVDEIAPEYSDIKPSNGTTEEYGRHEFNVTWTDNGRIGAVYIEHDFFGPVAKIPVASHEGNEYSYNTEFIDLGEYKWRMIAEDVAEQGHNENTTPWQDFTVVRANTDINWSIQPEEDIFFGNISTVGCAVINTENDESEIKLYLNGNQVPNPHTTQLSAGDQVYECSALQTEHYESLSENKTVHVYEAPSEINLTLNRAEANLTGIERLTEQVNISAESVSGNQELQLYIDGENVANGTSTIDYETTFNTTGNHTVEVMTAPDENYTTANASYSVEVVDTTAPDSITGLTKLSATAGSITIEWTNPSNDDFSHAIINVDGSDIANVTETNYTIEGLQPSTTYNITVYTADAYGNENRSVSIENNMVTDTAADTTLPVYSNMSSPADNQTYNASANYTFSIEWSDDVGIDTVEFEFDGANQTVSEVNRTYEVVLTGIEAGGHTFSWTANDTSGNSNTTGSQILTVLRAQSNVEILIDGDNQTVTVLEGIDVNITGNLLAGEENITLSVDGAEVANGTSPLEYITNFVAGTYVIEVSHPESTNYLASAENITLTAEPIERNVSLSADANKLTPKDANATYTVSVTNDGNIEDNYTITFTNDNTADVAELQPLTAVNVSPGETVELILTVGDNDTGDYNVTINAVSDTDGAVTDSIVVTTTVADYSTVINSTVAGTYYEYNQTSEIAQLAASAVEDSTVDGLSLLTTSTINTSEITNSTLTTCTVINSTVKDVVSSDCHIEDSYVDPSDTTGSTITGDSSVVNSTVTYSNVDNSSIADSNVNNTNVTNSRIESNSIVADSTVEDSEIFHANVTSTTLTQDSHISDATVDESELTNSSVWSGSEINESVLVDSVFCSAEAVNSSITGTDFCVDNNPLIEDANITDGVLVSGTITLLNGTVINGAGQNLTDIVDYRPKVDFTVSDNSVYTGDNVQFTSAVTDANLESSAYNESLTYFWDFGDGTNSTEENPSHSYSSESGSPYTVKLTVTDKTGLLDSETAEITVSKKSSSSSRSSGGSSRSSRSDGPRIIALNVTRGSFVTLDVYQRDVLEFVVDGAEHTVTINDITIDHVDVVVRSDPVAVTIAKYATENINLDDDMVNDMSIKVDDIIGNTKAKITIGLKELPSYDPIIIPDAQPDEDSEQDEASEEQDEEPEQDEAPEDQEEEPEEVEMGAWAKFVQWIKGIFTGDDEEAEPQEDNAEEGEEISFWQKLFGKNSESEDADAVTGAAVSDAEDEEEKPRALLGWFLVFLIIALGVASYFVIRQKVMESRLEKYLS